MSEFHDEYYKSFKIEVKLFKNSNPLVIRDVDDNIEEWVYSVKPPKELELLHGSHGFFFYTTYGDPTPTQAIANAKAKIDEVLGKKIGQLRADLEVLEKFNKEDDSYYLEISEIYKGSETITIQALNDDNFLMVYGFLKCHGFNVSKATGAFCIEITNIEYEDDESWVTWTDLVKWLLLEGCTFL